MQPPAATSAPNLSPALDLRDGRKIPRLGLGVYQARSGEETRAAVRAALQLGYRHIDTARIYRNEADVGQAIAASGIPREEIFVTTKLWNSDHGRSKAIAACRESVRRLGLSYVDLYLIHWPVPELRKESWQALVELRQEGLCRSIGVSNYMVHHLEELQSISSVLPAVNQVEISPFNTRAGLVAYCRARDIVVEAYSPLTQGRRLDHPAVVAVASRLGRTPAQVLLRWSLERGLVVLAKSTRPERLRENAAVFDFALGAEDHRALDGLDEGFVTGWDPTDAP